jgi:hypothetical protein
MNKKIIKDIALAIVTVVVLLGIAFGISAIVNSQVEKNAIKENLSSFVETPLEKGESLRLEKLSPIGKTLKDNGTIFVDESGEMWILNNFYAEKNEKFVALLSNKATNDKTDDIIVDIWLVLE